MTLMSFCEFRRFLRETAGNYAIMFAIAAFPIMGTISLAIEYSSIQRERSAVQQSLDARRCVIGNFRRQVRFPCLLDRVQGDAETGEGAIELADAYIAEGQGLA